MFKIKQWLRFTDKIPNHEEIIETIKENKSIDIKEKEEKKLEETSNMKNELKKYMNELNESESIPLSMTNDQLYQSF